uniref:Putative ovule protein n=1 Tax=Solanum chacoense TaxID=4108 RepID=A0A0V0HCE5_SOLCH
MQTVRDGVLSKYDYGSNDFNQAHYGETKPPRYNLTNIPHDFPCFSAMEAKMHCLMFKMLGHYLIISSTTM